MANYIIIGGDQKEYGPITADDVRQWITEGRLNEHSQIKAEGEVEFRALGTASEFGAAFLANDAIPPLPPSAFAIGRSGSEHDYELDIFACFSRAWGLVKNNFWILLISLVVLALVGFVFFGALGFVVSLIVPERLMAVAGFKVALNFFFSAVSALVMGPLVGGLYLVNLKTIRGEPTRVGDIFAGFQKAFLQLFFGYLAVVLVTGLCMAPFNYISTVRLAPLLAQMKSATPAEVQTLSPQIMSALVGVLPILLICMIPVTYLTVNWLFTQSLIIDKQMDFLTAMKTSWKMARKHWWHVFGLLVMTGLLNVAGLCACCVGVLFTIPIGIAALLFAYETIFSEG